MRRILLWIFLLASLVAPVWAQHYPFLPVSGTPHGIYTIFQDSHSALWLGTIDDAYRFDGVHSYSLRPYGFPKETPDGFTEDSDGGIWIATQGSDFQGGTGHGGLYLYQAGRVVKIASGDAMSVIALAPGFMLATMGMELNGKPSYGDITLFRKSKDGWTAETVFSKLAGHFTVDHQGSVLFPCPVGWCELSRQQLIDWRGSQSPLDLQRHSASPMIEKVLRDRFGCVWMRTEASASYQCPTDTKSQNVPATISQYDGSAHLEETADGSIFMLVSLILGRPGAFHVATGANGLPNNLDTAMVAKDGTIWLGTETGLVRFMYPFQIESWTKSDGMTGSDSVLQVGKDVLATSNQAGGVLKLDKDRRRWTPIPGSENLKGQLYAGPEHTFFVANRTGLTQLNATGQVEAKLVLPSNVDAFLTSSLQGRTWLAHGSISQVITSGNQLTLHPETSYDGRVRDLRYDDAHKILWACNGNSLLYLKDGVWGGIAQRDGLPDQICSSIAIQKNGDLWIGHDKGSYSWISDSSSGHPIIRNYSPWQNELASNNGTRFISIDSRDRLWIGKNFLNLSTIDNAKAGVWLRLDDQDGMDRLAGISTQQKVSDGSIWLTTASGITHFTPREDFASSFPGPPVFIAGISLNRGMPSLVDSRTSIPRDTQVVAHVGSLQFDRRNALQIRYRLLPQQTTWTMTSGLDINLGKLGWGSHTLQVQGRLLAGAWSPIAEQTLPVPWPLWLSWPFLLLYVSGGSTLAWTTNRWTKLRRMRRDLQLPDLSSWRLQALSPDTEHLLGTIVDGRYEIGHILSVGGFATVARGRDLKANGELCAVKIFRFEFGDQAWIRYRFKQEVTALEQLSHPNIVKITGHGYVDTGAPYLVMEFIQGRSLRELLQEGALPELQIARFLTQISSALALLHRALIYHRDLKPENLMIRHDANGDEQFVLIDFSIAIIKAPDQTFHGISRVAGTLGYMAPEQVTGYADASTDIHSLAKVLIEMLTGQSCSDLLPEATLDLPIHVRNYFKQHTGSLGAASIAAIASAVAFDPGQRPRDVEEFALPIIRDLEALA